MGEDNKSGVEDYIDLDRIKIGNGVEVLPMSEFLRDVAATGMLSGKPFELTENESFETVRGRRLWDYLSKACYSRPWQPGKTYLALNTTVMSEVEIDSARRKSMAIPGQNRQLRWYDANMAEQKAIFFSGSQKNRILTLFYAYLFFPRGRRKRDESSASYETGFVTRTKYTALVVG